MDALLTISIRDRATVHPEGWLGEGSGLYSSCSHDANGGSAQLPKASPARTTKLTAEIC